MLLSHGQHSQFKINCNRLQSVGNVGTQHLTGDIQCLAGLRPQGSTRPLLFIFLFLYLFLCYF